MTYRKELDGLRAIAVLSVLFAHAGYGVPSGGFIGVDVFFVLSGYLISHALIFDLEGGKLSIVNFYRRRARRLLPALFAVMFASAPFAYASMMPSQFDDFLKSVVAATFFCSNLLFWRSAGYFDSASWLKPLLHTWSLGVEEQFYIIFPLGLGLLWRFGRKLAFAGIVGAAVGSLVLSEWAWRHAPVANYYLAISRAWELLAGSVCAFTVRGRTSNGNNAASLSGFAMVIFSLFYFDESTPVPSVFALVPVSGTALILLYAQPTTWAGRLLSTPPLVGLGLMSYSLYLWHQPIFAFARIYSVGSPSRLSMACLIVLSFAMAWLSWRFVEQPFRNIRPDGLPSRRSILIGGLAFASMAICIVAVTRLLPIGSNSALFAMLDYPIDRAPYENCTDPGLARGAVDMCKINPNVRANAVLIGDSHAEDKLHGLYSEDRLRNWIVVASSGCAPFSNAYVGIAERDCDRKAKAAFDYIISSQTITTVAISFLSSYVSTALYAADHVDGLRRPFEATRPKYPHAPRQDVFSAGLFDLIKALYAHNKTVIFLMDQPELPFYPGDCLKGKSDCSLDEKVVLRRQAAYRDVIGKVGDAFPSLEIFDPISLFCRRGRCRYRDGDIIYYRDSNHLTLVGSQSYAHDFLAWERRRKKIGEQVAGQIDIDDR